MWICGRGRSPRRRPCAVAGCGVLHDVLCDHPVGKRGRACSRPLCADHATHTGPDEDLCPEHTPEARQAVELARRAAALVARVETAEGQLRAGEVLVVDPGLAAVSTANAQGQAPLGEE
jgi:hypothetical protein